MPATIGDILKTKPELITTAAETPLHDVLELQYVAHALQQALNRERGFHRALGVLPRDSFRTRALCVRFE